MFSRWPGKSGAQKCSPHQRDDTSVRAGDLVDFTHVLPALVGALAMSDHSVKSFSGRKLCLSLSVVPIHDSERILGIVSTSCNVEVRLCVLLRSLDCELHSSQTVVDVIKAGLQSSSVRRDLLQARKGTELKRKFGPEGPTWNDGSTLSRSSTRFTSLARLIH